jgi:hypothetical protein
LLLRREFHILEEGSSRGAGGMMDRNTRLARMAGHILEARENADPDEDVLLCRLIDMMLLELGKEIAASLAVEPRGALPQPVTQSPGRAPPRASLRRRRAR